MYKFLIVDTYYPEFLAEFYKGNSVQNNNYSGHLRLLMDKFFGTADFYSKNLEKLGCQAADIIFNDMKLQYRWLKEYASGSEMLQCLAPYGNLHKIINKSGVLPWQWQVPYKVLEKQIGYYEPDVLYIQDIGAISDRFLAEIKNKVKLIAGQVACSLPKNRDLRAYDVIFTSFAHFVDRFKNMGINAEYLKIAFEPRVWDKLKEEGLKRKYDCTFVGGLKKSHPKRIRILEELSEKLKLDIWGYGVDSLTPVSPIRKSYHSQAWGIEMYKVLAQSKITINIHIDAAENYANNMRLYEATGSGAMLITDYKDNLNDIFMMGKEVVAYRNVEELKELIRYYLTNEEQRQSIAGAGQARSLNSHTYYNRMRELLDILKRYMN